MAVAWRDGMSLGVAELDADHKRLIDLVNVGEIAVAEKKHDRVRAILAALVAYGDDHFPKEEAVMAAAKFPLLTEHKVLHQALSRRARLLQQKYVAAVDNDERDKIGAVVTAVLNEWLLNHVIREDIKLARYTKNIEQGAVVLTGMPAEISDEERKRQRAERDRDTEYQLPPNLAHLLTRVEYVVPDLPPVKGGFASFERLFEAAICRRIDNILVFFQRHNPSRTLELPPTFLASPVFAEKFYDAVSKFIFPVIWNSRQVKMLASSLEWAEMDVDTFWGKVSRQMQETILGSWNAAWEDMMLIEVAKPDGTKVWQVKEPTKKLREMLHAPDNAYDLPRVGNREIQIFRSLMDPCNDWWLRLNQIWQTCHDLYEQEKDPRVFQQKAREGALRDGLLGIFSKFPEQWGDFLVLTCHRVFPRISTQFLESFTTNWGRNQAEREAYVPYTIRYLRQVHDHPEIRQRERAEEEEWQAQMQELRNYLTGRTKLDS